MSANDRYSELESIAHFVLKGREFKKTRIAPTPSGFLHLGNAINFLLTYHLAKAAGAKVALRIDDIDASRVRNEYVEDVFRSLDWLGIEPDEGPKSSAEFQKSWSQSQQLESYHDTLNKLLEKDVLEACTCSRKTLAKERCNCDTALFEEFDYSWRFRPNDSLVVRWSELSNAQDSVILSEVMPDAVLRKRDGSPSYQVASLVDDERLGIDLIVRGADLIGSTALQMHLASLLGLSNFSSVSFFHHELVMDEVGNKLSKSDGAMSLSAMMNEPGSLDHVLTQCAIQMKKMVQLR